MNEVCFSQMINGEIGEFLYQLAMQEWGENPESFEKLMKEAGYEQIPGEREENWKKVDEFTKKYACIIYFELQGKTVTEEVKKEWLRRKQDEAEE